MPDSPPILAYADELARLGVAWQRNDGIFRLVVPPLPSWRDLGLWHYLAIIYFAVANVMWIAMLRGREPVAIPSLMLYSLALAMIVYLAVYRLRRRLVFELDHNELRIRSSLPAPGAAHAWKRQNITEIKLNAFDGKLLIRAHGRDMVSIDTGPRQRVTQWIAQRLTEELHEPVNAASVDVPTPAPEQPAAPRSARRGRSLLLALSACMFIAGVGLCFVRLPWPVFGWYLILASAAPAGIALGTQEREYYI
jgi:hypothetical protein